MATSVKQSYSGHSHLIACEDESLVRMVRPRAIRPRPCRIQDVALLEAASALVEEEAPVQLVRPIALKPSAIVIPKEATEEFYARAHAEGLMGSEVNAAIMESQDWHRKWTHQDEKGHTQPETVAREPQQVLPSYYAFAAEDRMLGAKNPSPDDRDSMEPVLRRRVEYSEDLDPRKRQRPQAKAISPQPTASLECQPPPYFHPPTVQPVLVRPVPVRVTRANLILPPPPNYSELPPQEVMLDAIIRQRSLSGASYYSSISPMTLPSITRSSSSSTGSAHHNTEIKDAMAPPVHIIEPEMNIPPTVASTAIQNARDGILHQLAVSGGETTSQEFQDCLEVLQCHFTEDMSIDTCASDCFMSEGMWLTLTNALFFSNLGENDAGDAMYTLGRMSFDMFSPTQIVCSLQGNFNSVERVSSRDRKDLIDHSAVPKSLLEEVESTSSLLRTYNVITAFTIELPLCDYPNAPNKDVRKPIRGIMTTFGYTLPDPEQPNRHSVWITGGKIEPNDDPQDQAEWKRLFGMHPPQHSFGEKAKLLAVKLLMGATIPTEMKPDGSLEYTFTRPLGGHGMAYVDTLYVDETMRIVRGHRGTTFVFSRHTM